MNEIKKLWLSVGAVSAAGLAVAALSGAAILAAQPARTQGVGKAQATIVSGAASTTVPTPVVTAPTGVDVSGAGVNAGAGGATSATLMPGGQAGARPLTELVDPTWLQQTAQATGVPERALAAYAGAAIYMEQVQPGCHLGWNTLAAIGKVESDHGSLGDAKLDASGYVKPAIRGVPLRGQETQGQRLARIVDTDDGRLDGDAQWDRAVGPMQFLPGTWASYAADGNGDSVATPDQIDDAALTAARYLCAAGNDLNTPENWIAAIKTYNDSAEYNNQVADAAQQLANSTRTIR